jgi:4-hydroxy-2-oxoheptanedioate aldolase
MREKLLNGKKVLGTFFQSGSEAVMEAIAVSGLDFVIIDKEHGPIGVETALGLIRAAELRNITPLVRIKDISRSSVLKVLDIGAQGIIVPAVPGIDDAKKLVEYGKYIPIGARGAAMGRAADFGHGEYADDIMAHFAHHNEQTMIIPMCESVEFLESIEEILQMDGIDGVFIGPFDLSIALGKPAQFSDPAVASAFERVLKACQATRKFCFIYAPTAEKAKDYFRQGFDGVAVEIDLQVVISGYKEIIRRVKA